MPPLTLQEQLELERLRNALSGRMGIPRNYAGAEAMWSNDMASVRSQPGENVPMFPFFMNYDPTFGVQQKYSEGVLGPHLSKLYEPRTRGHHDREFSQTTDFSLNYSELLDRERRAREDAQREADSSRYGAPGSAHGSTGYASRAYSDNWHHKDINITQREILQRLGLIPYRPVFR